MHKLSAVNEIMLHATCATCKGKVKIVRSTSLSTGEQKFHCSNDIFSEQTKRSKFGSVRTTVTDLNGVERKFASKGEARRFQELELMVRARQISNLRLQVRFPFIIKNITVTTYVADFVYRERGKAEDTVEDFKGFRDAKYKIKAKLMLAIYNIKILETGGSNK